MRSLKPRLTEGIIQGEQSLVKSKSLVGALFVAAAGPDRQPMPRLEPSA